jgi:hypothetical protein
MQLTTIEMRKACAAERETLCAGKSGKAADRCVVYHRLKASEPSKHALVRLELTQEGRL